MAEVSVTFRLACQFGCYASFSILGRLRFRRLEWAHAQEKV